MKVSMIKLFKFYLRSLSRLRLRLRRLLFRSRERDLDRERERERRRPPRDRPPEEPQRLFFELEWSSTIWIYTG